MNAATSERFYQKRHRSGSTTTWVKLMPGENVVILKPGQSAMVLEEGAHYRLGGQLDDVVATHVLQEAAQVVWCSITQAWVDTGSDIHQQGAS